MDALADARLSPLWSEDPAGDALSVASSVGQEALPDAWRGEGSGAPSGSRNGRFRTGQRTQEMKELQRMVAQLLRTIHEGKDHEDPEQPSPR